MLLITRVCVCVLPSLLSCLVVLVLFTTSSHGPPSCSVSKAPPPVTLCRGSVCRSEGVGGRGQGGGRAVPTGLLLLLFLAPQRATPIHPPVHLLSDPTRLGAPPPQELEEPQMKCKGRDSGWLLLLSVEVKGGRDATSQSTFRTPPRRPFRAPLGSSGLIGCREAPHRVRRTRGSQACDRGPDVFLLWATRRRALPKDEELWVPVFFFFYPPKYNIKSYGNVLSGLYSEEFSEAQFFSEFIQCPSSLLSEDQVVCFGSRSFDDLLESHTRRKAQTEWDVEMGGEEVEHDSSLSQVWALFCEAVELLRGFPGGSRYFKGTCWAPLRKRVTQIFPSSGNFVNTIVTTLKWRYCTLRQYSCSLAAGANVKLCFIPLLIHLPFFVILKFCKTTFLTFGNCVATNPFMTSLIRLWRMKTRYFVRKRLRGMLLGNFPQTLLTLTFFKAVCLSQKRTLRT